MLSYFAKRPMLVTAAAACLVCAIGYSSMPALLIFGVLFIAAFFFLLARKRPSLAAAAVLLFLVTGALLLSACRIDRLNRLDNRIVEGEFLVCEKPAAFGDYYTMTVRFTGSEEPLNKARIFAFSGKGDVTCGDIVRGRIRLQSLKDSAYRDSNYAERIYLQGSFLEWEKTGKSYAPYAAAEAVRTYISDTLFGAMRFEDASVLCALVYGDRSYLSADFDQLVKRAGVSHILVVSGMHMAVMVSLFSGLYERIGYHRFLKAAVLILVAGFMMLLCGFTKSVLRAGFTYFLLAFSILIGRESDPANTLGSAVTLLLIGNPFTVHSIAFRLSVLSTFGILAVALPMLRVLRTHPAFSRPLSKLLLSSVLVSVCASLYTMPEAIHDFGGIPIFSVLTCLLITFAATLALELAVIGLPLHGLSALAAAPFFAAGAWLVRYIRFVVEKIGSLKAAFLSLDESAAGAVAAIDLLILFGLLAYDQKQNRRKRQMIEEKVIEEGGGKLKWQSYTKKL